MTATPKRSYEPRWFRSIRVTPVRNQQNASIRSATGIAAPRMKRSAQLREKSMPNCERTMLATAAGDSDRPRRLSPEGCGSSPARSRCQEAAGNGWPRRECQSRRKSTATPRRGQRVASVACRSRTRRRPAAWPRHRGRAPAERAMPQVIRLGQSLRCQCCDIPFRQQPGYREQQKSACQRKVRRDVCPDRVK